MNIFYDGKSALEHINKIWDDPQNGGMKKFQCKKKFENLVCKTSNKALKNVIFLRNCYNLINLDLFKNYL